MTSIPRRVHSCVSAPSILRLYRLHHSIASIRLHPASTTPPILALRDPSSSPLPFLITWYDVTRDVLRMGLCTCILFWVCAPS